MSHAQICPVCNGEGMLPQRGTLTGDTGMRTCHACAGTGWVTVYGD